MVACNNNHDNKKTSIPPDIGSTTTLHSLNTDTLFINKTAAVYYWPDSKQMEKWKKEAGAENFEIAAGDWSYYIMTSKEYLKTTNILPEDATGKKVLKFIKANQSSTIIRLDTLKKHLGLYLFSVEKEPVYANIVSIEDSYKTYFNGIAAIEVKK